MGLQFKKDLPYKSFILRGEKVVIDDVKDDEEFKQKLYAHDPTLFENGDEKPTKKRRTGRQINNEPVLVDHLVTEEDLINNPALSCEGIKVGETIQIPAPEGD